MNVVLSQTSSGLEEQRGTRASSIMGGFTSAFSEAAGQNWALCLLRIHTLTRLNGSGVADYLDVYLVQVELMARFLVVQSLERMLEIRLEQDPLDRTVENADILELSNQEVGEIRYSNESAAQTVMNETVITTESQKSPFQTAISNDGGSVDDFDFGDNHNEQPDNFSGNHTITKDRTVILNAIAAQFPIAMPLGVELRFKDNWVLVEITTRDEAQRHALETIGLNIHGHPIIGTPALRKGSGFLGISLYHLPHRPESELQQRHSIHASSFWKSLGDQLVLSPEYSVFIGQGCAYRDVSQTDMQLSTHTTLHPGLDYYVRAFWKGLPPYCRLCREDTHEKEHCPRAKTHNVKAFHRCGNYGHAVSSCPRSVIATDFAQTVPDQDLVSCDLARTAAASVNELPSYATVPVEHGNIEVYSSAPNSPTLSQDMEVDMVTLSLENSISSSASDPSGPDASPAGDSSTQPSFLKSVNDVAVKLWDSTCSDSGTRRSTRNPKLNPKYQWKTSD
ncbi:hypothetical protein BDB00DRAFT_933797 [Zychaea mexicana]|uniref:uncharacterized protein n=1 Tax=Zychaea mexicana TaxID=64656 RepID=UPI0022FDEA33|nr:uncharacterized protein BDB00DRAFT_933797 [Zychaea mexicana]KAI9484284.1 hypothetical protein BDB00DRAFT_933797 [Zychaea mexicana]